VAMALSRIGFSFVYTSDTRPKPPGFRFRVDRRRRIFSRWQSPALHFRRVPHRAAQPAISRCCWRRLHPDSGRRSSQYLAPTPGPDLARCGSPQCRPGSGGGAARPGSSRVRIRAEPGGSIPSDGRAGELRGPAGGKSPNRTATLLSTLTAASPRVPCCHSRRKDSRDGSAAGNLAVTATVPVPTMRLDTFLDGAGIRTVDYLQIDVQGAGLAVIRSAGERLQDIGRISLVVQTTPFERIGVRRVRMMSCDS